MNSLQFVDSTHKQEINELRMREYVRASGFSVDVSTLGWKTSDDESFVMAAFGENGIVSTMRGEIIAEQPMLERKLECAWNFPLHLEYPVLLLSRAATDSSVRTSGLNLLQRYWFLRLAEYHKLPFVIGTFVSGSPREQTLREMGYQFFTNEIGWLQSTYRSHRSVNVVALDMRTDGRRALDYCLERLGHGLNDYPFNGEFPSMKIVRSI